jgi:peptidoglycan/xylan/chitin deacetylase (PgdA/CDA1 family)
LLQLFKTLAGLALGNPSLAAYMRRRQRVRLVSLCFHRFAGPENAGVGHDLEAIDESLRWLQQAGFAFGDLDSVAQGLAGGRLPDRPTVVMSIDDGYADIASALPVFGRHGCPVTVFLATDFLDRRAPLWWDQVQMLLARAPGSMTLRDVAGITWSARWQSDAERLRHGEALVEIIKRTREPARLHVIEALAKAVNAPLPMGETAGYLPLRWDDVRAMERDGVRFGPHTHTHPILTALGDAEARSEIETSWMRLRDELQRPLPIFAYPDGTPWSYAERHVSLVRELGLRAAVTMDAGWAPPETLPIDPYRVGRLGYQSRPADFRASVLRLGAILRHGHPMRS